jgi:hypothetical protein
VSSSPTASGTWPADVIHVNEDGWVLVNRGSQHGVFVGMRLVVVGTGIRELHDLFAPDSDSNTQSPALRIRRTYELLEVIYTEPGCAIAIATRTPPTRRPTVFRGPEQELLVWVPLPEGYSWPPTGEALSASDAGDATSEDDETIADNDTSAGEADAPPEHGPQDDELWEESLPLNSVSVGDIVLPAVPAAPASPTSASAPTTTPGAISGDPAETHAPTTPYDAGRTYDWMKKPGE